MVLLQALLLCDQVVQAPDGKVQLQGLFDTVSASSVPAAHPCLWVFFRFLLQGKEKDASGNYPVRLFLHRPSGATDEIPEMKANADGMGVIQGYLQLRGMVLKEAGEHWFELFCKDKSVGSCRFIVKIASPKSLQPPSASTIH